jgi:NADH-quinone oxidoreductase subunit L
MPVTFAGWLGGVGALVGIPPLAGLFSKDLIIDSVAGTQPLAGAALFTAVFVTGLYSARATRLAFFGTAGRKKPAHEGSGVMLGPLVALAVPAAVLGFAGTWLSVKLGHEPEALPVLLSAVAVGAALAGVVAGWYLEEGQGADGALEARAGVAWRASASAFGFDALVDRLFVRPTVWAASALWRFVDRIVIDGAVEGSAKVARSAGALSSAIQTGDTQRYAAAIVIGVAVLLGLGVWVGR